MKLTIVLLSLMSLTACATSSKLPMPTGKPVAVNSAATSEMLAHQAGLMIVGTARSDPAVKQALIHDGLKRKLSRQPERSDYARVPGAALVERVVMVGFPSGSSTFKPTSEQRLQLRLLLSVADRVEVRGRTDGRGNRTADERMAHKRAEAAKRYLLDRGVPSDIIAVNYQAAGDYIADNERATGRNMNRRVEIEFYIDDFTTDRAAGIALLESDPL